MEARVRFKARLKADGTVDTSVSTSAPSQHSLEVAPRAKRARRQQQRERAMQGVQGEASASTQTTGQRPSGGSGHGTADSAAVRVSGGDAAAVGGERSAQLRTSLLPVHFPPATGAHDLSTLPLPAELMELVLPFLPFQLSSHSGRDARQALVALGGVNRALAWLTQDDALWQRLWQRTFANDDVAGSSTSASASASNTQPPPHWRTRFKHSLEQRRRRLMQLHRRHVLRLQSELHVARQTQRRHEDVLAGEMRRCNKLRTSLVELQRHQQAHSASQVWRPAVVAAHHRAVLEQMPVDTAAEEHQLNQHIAESRLEVRRLRNTLAAQERRLAELTSTLRVAEATKPWLHEQHLRSAPPQPDGLKED